MLKILVKKQLTEIFRAYFYDAKKNKARSKVSIILWFIFYIGIMVGILGGMFTYLSVALCSGLCNAGASWLYFAILGLISLILGVFGSVFNTYASLYKSKDNDLLLSMPIPVSKIVLSRLAAVYILGFLYSGTAIIPAVLVYLITFSHTAKEIAGCLLLIAVIALFVGILSCLLGWVVAKISNKLKNRNIITVIVSIAGISIYYFIYYKAQEIISELLTNAAFYAEKIKGSAFPVYLFGKIGTGNAVSCLVFALISVILSVLVIKLISDSFIKFATASNAVTGKSEKIKSFKQSSVFGALLKKELGRFLGSPNYMLNCGLGTVIMPVLGIVLIIKGGALLPILNDVFGTDKNVVPVLFSSALMMISSINDMAAPSVSLEGKNIWILQSMPVNTAVILKAKASLQFIITVIPVFFCLVCSVFVIPYKPIELILVAAVILSSLLFFSLFDLFLNLKMPNLSWTNEIVPIKQSASVAISIFGVWIISAAVAGIYLLFGYRLGNTVYLSAVFALFAVFSLLLIKWLANKGTEIFENL